MVGYGSYSDLNVHVKEIIIIIIAIIIAIIITLYPLILLISLKPLRLPVVCLATCSRGVQYRDMSAKQQQQRQKHHA